jgi:hypothetical protein
MFSLCFSIALPSTSYLALVTISLSKFQGYSTLTKPLLSIWLPFRHRGINRFLAAWSSGQSMMRRIAPVAYCQDGPSFAKFDDRNTRRVQLDRATIKRKLRFGPVEVEFFVRRNQPWR